MDEIEWDFVEGNDLVLSAGDGLVIYESDDLLILDSGWKVPNAEPSANLELEQIIKEFQVAEFLGEIARYRIWRLHKSDNWKQIVDDSNLQKYNSWEDVITDLSELLHCGRQQLFDRVRVYEQLSWLGYSPEESIKMVAQRPSLYTRVLSMVMDWDQRKEQPRSISIPTMDKATKEDAVGYIRELLDDVTTFDTQKEAIKYVSESVLLEPQVDFWYNGDVVYVKYFQQSINPDGTMQVQDYGNVTFYPDSDMPEWAKTKLEGMFKSVGKYDANKKP